MARSSAFARLKEPEEAAPLPPTAALPELGPSVVNDKRPPQASRIGKKTVIFYDNPEVVRELKRIGVDTDRTVQDMMQEAVDDFLVKNGKHAFGKR